MTLNAALKLHLDDLQGGLSPQLTLDSRTKPLRKTGSRVLSQEEMPMGRVRLSLGFQGGEGMFESEFEARKERAEIDEYREIPERGIVLPTSLPQ